MLGKIKRQQEKGATEDELIERHHRLNRHEFEQTQGGLEGQRLQFMELLRVRHELNLVTEQQQGTIGMHGVPF